jgi:hypothetical protein
LLNVEEQRRQERYSLAVACVPKQIDYLLTLGDPDSDQARNFG